MSTREAECLEHVRTRSEERLTEKGDESVVFERGDAQYLLLHYDKLPLELFLPFDHGVNPEWGRAQKDSHDWVARMDLVEASRWRAFTGARFDELAARAYPHVTAETLSLVTDFIITLFVLDDLVDHQASALGSRWGEMTRLKMYLEESVVGKRSESLPSGHYVSAITSIGKAFQEITHRLLAHARIEDLEHYIAGMRGYLGGCVEEALIRHKHRPPIDSLEAYANLRLECGALYPCFEIGLIAAGIQLPEHIRSRPAFQTMWDSANLSVCYINDIFSYNKDVWHGHVTNLLIVLQDVGGLTAERAYHAARGIHDSIVLDYQAAKQSLELEGAAEWEGWPFVTALLES